MSPRAARGPFQLPAARRASGTAAMTATRILARWLGRGLARVEVIGLDRLPAAGGVLLAVNHTALVDGPLVYGVLPRPAVFLIKAEAFRGPVGALLRRIGQIPVRRGTAERAPLAAALDTLAAGGVVGVFPEGTRRGGEVDRVERGVAYLALRSGCPLHPVACHGTARLRGRAAARSWRPPVRVVIGEQVALPEGARASRRTVAEAADRVRGALATHVAATRPTFVRRPEDQQR